MEVNKTLQDLMRILRLTHEAEDHTVIEEAITKAIVFRGTNLWILIFAIIVASVGLNMNSTAVIIGAMLISPLMGPINGVGYSVATYNFDLFRKALKNYVFATIAALSTSTIYFLITPIHTEHSELLARTSPTIYDVIIALFGGLAGIVAISSKNKGNVIPGVAIATALMPPLCTAGYGLAIGNFSYFFGALYLYAINSVFIALSAMIVSQLLKMPRKTYLLSKEIKNKNIAVAVVTILTVVPSVYFGFTLVKKERFQHTAELFVNKVSLWDNNYLLSSKIDTDTKTISLVYGGTNLTDDSKKRLTEKAEDLGLEGVTIKPTSGFSIEDPRLNDLDKRTSELEEARGELNRLNLTVQSKDVFIDSLQSIPSIGKQLLKEIHTIYPTIHGCSYANSRVYVDSLETYKDVSLVLFDIEESLSEEENNKLKAWVQNRLNSKNVIVKF